MVAPVLRLSTADQLSLSAVFACVRVIAEAIASSPWDVYQLEGRKRILLPDDPLHWLLNVRPNPDTTAQSFREALIVQTIVHGNGYAEIVRDRAGRVIELQVLPSERVQVARDPDGKLYYVYSQYQGGQVRLEQDEVFHLRALASVDGLMGDSILGRAAKAVASAHAAEQFSLAYFANMGQPGVIMKVPRPLKPDEEASLMRSWEASRGGAGKAFKPVIAPGGVEVVSSEVKATDAQVIPSRQFSVEEVLRFFGVPPHLVGVSIASQGYGRNLSELGLTFTRHTLRAWTKRLDQEATFKLLPQRKPWRYVEMDLTWLAEADALTNAQEKEVLFRNGILSKNEWRDSLNMNDIPDGDRYDGKPSEAPEPADGVDPLAEETDPSDEDAGPSEHAGDEMAMKAVNRLLQDRLERHVKRLQARETDLRRTNTNGVLGQKLEQSRQELRARALRELHGSDDLFPVKGEELNNLYLVAIEAVESGDINEVAAALTVQLLGDQS
ncbi:phage portal protein [Anaeromyxobacter sp. PSR-1]|uniref:phage portal protein n=1 Tax=Anaeromyxobacter sp. PSR-1 TaxID=1300915 RepID=UPI0005E5908A|nr:phage portal protein [Anaeromyxobacter sp. PSR-1]GAO01933.1 portal protein [Anaeromyxobacter sp. PSR-1]